MDASTTATGHAAVSRHTGPCTRYGPTLNVMRRNVLGPWTAVGAIELGPTMHQSSLGGGTLKSL